VLGGSRGGEETRAGERLQCPLENHVPFINEWKMATNYTRELNHRDQLVGD